MYITNKVRKYGVRGREFNLLKSLLEDRKQCASVGSVCSDKIPITKGIL